MDCVIDDPELMETKKHLMSKGNPVGIIEVLKGKNKMLGFIENLELRKDPKTNKDFFTVAWTLKGYTQIKV